jgi:hypothetical protein
MIEIRKTNDPTHPPTPHPPSPNKNLYFLDDITESKQHEYPTRSMCRRETAYKLKQAHVIINNLSPKHKRRLQKV